MCNTFVHLYVEMFGGRGGPKTTTLVKCLAGTDLFIANRPHKYKQLQQQRYVDLANPVGSLGYCADQTSTVCGRMTMVKATIFVVGHINISKAILIVVE